MDRIKIFEAFAGIGAFSKGFDNLELVGFSELDKYAEKSYCAIHGVSKDLNYGDITKIDTDILPDFDLFTWGFPCQDISVAGSQKGIIKGETRSGLYYEGLRILKAKLPKYSIIENVKNLIGKKFKAEFEQILLDLKELGYTNYWKVLNLKNYGLPQNRERVFIVSIRGEHKPFEFAEGFDNGLRLKDMLEHEVDEKYYIGSEKVQKLLEQLRKEYENGEVQEKIGNMREPKPRTDGICNTISTVQKDNMLCVPCLTPERVEKRQNGRRFKGDGEPMFTLTGQDRHGVMQVGNIVDTGNFENPQRGRIYSGEGVSPALNTCGGGGLEPKIIEKNQIIKIGSFDRETIKDHECQRRVYSKKSIFPNLNARSDSPKVIEKYKIRKLTPKECFRLMGFSDEDFQKCLDAGISNTQLYKQAGNSIGIPIIKMIADQLQLTK